MNLNAISENVPLILIAIGIISLLYFLRRPRAERRRPEIVRNLLFAVRLNLALVATFHQRPKPKKFETASWLMDKTKLGFLAPPLQAALSEAFVMIEDLNRQIKAASKSKSIGGLANINVDKLKEPLAQSQQGLEEWLLVNVGGKEPPPQYPGMFDIFLGSRR